MLVSGERRVSLGEKEVFSLDLKTEKESLLRAYDVHYISK